MVRVGVKNMKLNDLRPRACAGRNKLRRRRGIGSGLGKLPAVVTKV